MPNRPDIIMTSDGVLMDIHTLRRMTPQEYETFKSVNSIYDYQQSKVAGELILKKKEDDNSMTTENTTKDITETKLEPEKENSSTPRETIEKDIQPKKKTIRKKTRRRSRKSKISFNLFEDFGRYLMLLVSVGTGILSVYYTTNYLQSLNNPFTIALLLSSTMYIFGLFGINFSHTFRIRGNKGLSVLFMICGLTTIGASVLSSADVNMSNYLKNVAEHEKVIESEKGQTLKVQILQDELHSNKEQISVLQKDIETQSKVYVRSWSNELNDFVMIEGKITEIANTQINRDKEQIEQLQKRNTDINTQLIELADRGVSFEEKKSKLSISLSQVLGNLFHIKSDYIHLIILLFYSCFIDIVSVLGLTAFYRLKEEKN